MAVPTGRESDKFMLRLPDGMRDRIKAAAEANKRSMNAEIVAALDDRYPAPPIDSPWLTRFQGVIELFDAATNKLIPFEQRKDELSDLKDMLIKIINRMTVKEIEEAQASVWLPGELDMFEDWPPQRWLSVGNDAGYGGDGTGDGYGDGDGAYGDSDGNGDGMGGRS
ncbi:Arc family DNA-binding protein [Paracoccus denitrificans]|uniref:Arc family DNA-binding protein n=1 Tax=Paracoccus denitrificans TaxID=266 RepID=UPI001E61E482|nr:Arc family DNA-binding protein [Paracoccus denitrificans]UFS65165.1 Arc family DNA-binding protein [Paracoccus denitrificans]